MATFTATPQQQTPRTLTPTPTNTPHPTTTATPTLYVVNSNANVRSGPGTAFPIVGSQEQGDTLTPVARTADGEWLQIGSTEWIWTGLVDGNIAAIQVTHNIPISPTVTPTPLPTSTIANTPVPRPTVSDSEVNPICLTSDALAFIEESTAIRNNIDETLRNIADENSDNVDWIYNIVKLQDIYSDVLDITPPSGFWEAYEHFLDGALWYNFFANAIEMFLTWDQRHWLETARERLETANHHMALMDISMTEICYA